MAKVSKEERLEQDGVEDPILFWGIFSNFTKHVLDAGPSFVGVISDGLMVSITVMCYTISGKHP